MADDAVRQPRASDAEVEAYLARLRASSEQPGPWNLATLTGLLLVAAGVAYLAQQMGMPIGWDLSWLMRLLPILGGVLIILLGLGVLSRPRRSPEPVPNRPAPAASSKPAPKRLERSRQGKIAGVCAGLAQYFGVDPTLVRLLFVVLTLFFGGSGIALYVILWFIMPRASRSVEIPIQ
jgi:phage shock protein C|nr:MAG: hypothetical protein KatS3mg041_0033 [Bacteroidota bacterium]